MDRYTAGRMHEILTGRHTGRGWLSQCRAIPVRYEKKSANYLGLIKVAYILIWCRRQHRLSLSRKFLID